MSNYQKILSVFLTLILAFGSLTAIPASAGELSGPVVRFPDEDDDVATPDSTWDEWDVATEDEYLTFESTVDERYPDFRFGIIDVMPDITGYDGSDQEKLIGAVLRAYCGNEKNVEVPAELGGYPVYVLSDAFMNNETVETVTLPDTIRVVRYGAFENCTALKRVDLPDTARLEQGVFRNCTSLEEFTLPASQTVIDCTLFYGCTSLREVNIPASVEEINRIEALNMSPLDPFYRCSSIERFNVAADNEYYTSVDGAIYTKDMSVLVAYPPTAESIKLSDSVQMIGDRALSGNPHITSITLPASVTYIGSAAFADCTALEEIKLEDNSASLGYRVVNGTKLKNMDPFGLVKIGSVVYSYNKNLTDHVVIPDGITKINDNAFTEFSTVEWIEIDSPYGEKWMIPSEQTADFTSIYVPASVVTIGPRGLGSSPDQARTVYGYSGSVAEKAAKESGYGFISVGKLVTDEATGISVGVKNDEELVVSPLHADDTQLAAYDITLKKDGSTVQPGGEVAVRIPCEFNTARVYHVDEEGNYTDMDAAYTDGYLVFMTDHFSKYVITRAPLGNRLRLHGEIEGCGALDTVNLILKGKGEEQSSTVSAEFGYFFKDLTVGDYTLTVSVEGYAPITYTLTVNDDLQHDVKLSRYGDVNGDGRITTMDFGMANACARGTRTLEGYMFSCADMNGDGKITTIDAGRINSIARTQSKPM